MLKTKPDPALSTLEYALRLADVLGWTGRLELHVSGGNAIHVIPTADFPLLEPMPSVDLSTPLSESQEAVITRVGQRLASIKGSIVTYIYIPIEDGEPGELRERPRFDVAPRNGRR